MTAVAKPKRKEKLETNPYRFWAARFWHGMLISAWWRLLRKNRFRVSLTRIPLATTISWCTIFNSLARPVQNLVYGRRLARTEISEDPIFIIGHWRSGTTMLHELLVLDERFTYPDSYQCFAPNHFLVTRWLITKLTFLLPKQRPMDNMLMGWDRPQEDEFAICNMGLPSPYLTMAFPNEPPHHPEYLDFKNVSEEDRARWQHLLREFLRAITLRTPKRIVLKSPPHTGRIKVLLEMFPRARFVHIVRDPYNLFASNIKLWKTLYKYQALQEPKNQGLDEFVFSSFERMYAAFDEQRALIDPSRFYELRYEDLVADQTGQMRALYEHLGLGDFEQVLPKLEDYLAKTRDYQTNKWQSDPALEAKIDERWGPYMEQYGYGPVGSRQ